MLKVIVCFVVLVILALVAYCFWPRKKKPTKTLDPEAQKLYDYFTGKTDFVEIDGIAIGPPETKPKKPDGMDPKSRTMLQIIQEEPKPETQQKKFKFVPPKPPISLKPEEKPRKKKAPELEI